MAGACLATAGLTLEIKSFALHYDRIMITPRSNLRAAVMPLHAPQRFATRIALICCSLSLLFVPRGIINAFCNRPTVNGPYSDVSLSVSRIYLRLLFPSRPLPPPGSRLCSVRSRSPNYRVVAKSMKTFAFADFAYLPIP